MPRIPTGTSQAPYPGRPISPERATVEARALSEAGEKLAAVGKVIMEREQKAARAEKGLRIENQMNEDIGKLAESYYDRIDYDNFEKDAQESLTALRSKYEEMAKGDRELRISVDREFNHESAKFMHMIRQKKRQVLVERSLGEFQTFYRQSLEDYANALDEDARELIRTKVQMRAQVFADTHIMTAAEADMAVVKFASDADETRIDKLININPDTALELLEAGGAQGLDPKTRQQKIDKAIIAKRKRQVDEDRAERIAHDEEERVIGDLVLAGNYSDAFDVVLKSELLKGDEKVQWQKSIRKLANNVEEDIDPYLQATEIANVNKMIAMGMAPEYIERYIIQSPNLLKEDKEQFILKIQTELDAIMDEGRKTAYRDIENMIIPKRGMLTRIVQTPLETRAVAMAQMQFDEWLYQQRKEGKHPSKNEIRLKAMEIAQSNQVPVSEQIRYLEEESRLQAAEMKAYGEQKLKEGK